jgi:ATP-dependent Clp protease adaptor protein ClpS
VARTAPVETERPVGEEDVVPDVPWIVIVWNDPINLMSYVVYVFQKLFGYPREKATKLMLDVHHKGKAVVAEGPRERCEFDVSRLHAHGLWATMQKDRCAWPPRSSARAGADSICGSPRRSVTCS